MRPNKRLIALTLSTVLLLSVIGPGLAMAQEGDAEAELDVDVDQDDGVLITVSDENGTVDNASVDVTVIDENATYDDAGDYSTDENGTVGLSTPNESVNVSIVAEKDNATGSTDVLLEAPEEDADDADDGAFGQQVQQWVHDLMNGNATDVPMGHHVATFVTENNPGNAPDHAGPKNDTGPPEHAGPDGERGPPDHAGPGNDTGNQGAPSDDVTAEDETEEDGDDETTDDETTDDETTDDETTDDETEQ